MRRCPFDGCTEEIDPRLFACRRHWNRLNCDQKRAIYRAYDAYKAGRISPLELDDRQRQVLAEVRERKAPRGA